MPAKNWGKNVLRYLGFGNDDPCYLVRQVCEANDSLKGAAKQLGINTTTLRHICRLNDIPYNRGKKKVMEIDRVIEVSNCSATLQDAANALGKSKSWLIQYNQKHGLHFVYKGRPPRRSKLDAWIRSHPGEKLPRNGKEAAARLGISHQAYLVTLYRRRKRALKRLEDLPFNELPVPYIELDDGKKIPPQGIASWAYSLKGLDGKVTVMVKLHSGLEGITRIPYQKLLGFLPSQNI
jgi:hypothetical protein